MKTSIQDKITIAAIVIVFGIPVLFCLLIYGIIRISRAIIKKIKG